MRDGWLRDRPGADGPRWLRDGPQSRAQQEAAWLRDAPRPAPEARAGRVPPRPEPRDGPAPAAPPGGPVADDLDGGGPTVRLAVSTRALAVGVEGRSLTARDAAGGAGVFAGRPGDGAVALTPVAGVVAVDGRATGTPRLLVEGAGPLAVALDGGAPRRLRGAVEVVANGDGLVVVNEVPLERYLAGVVPLEVDPAWPPEALKAQAVASRTYALHRRQVRRTTGEALYDLEPTVADQVYGWLDAEDPRAVAAIAATQGEWLADADGLPILAAFHSTAGGRTEWSEEVWGEARPYLVGVACPYDRESPVFEWRVAVPAAEVERRLVEAGYPARALAALAVVDRTAGDRARALDATGAAGTFRLRATDLRRLLGYGRLRSTNFDVTLVRDVFVFDGRGAGHGVGLCQWGARGMALAGHGYREILAFYYAGARLVAGAPR